MDKLIIESKIVSDDLASFQWNLDLDADDKKFSHVASLLIQVLID